MINTVEGNLQVYNERVLLDQRVTERNGLVVIRNCVVVLVEDVNLIADWDRKSAGFYPVLQSCHIFLDGHKLIGGDIRGCVIMDRADESVKEGCVRLP